MAKENQISSKVKHSNYIALSFVLSDRLQINRTEFYNCVHRGIDVSEDS